MNLLELQRSAESHQNALKVIITKREFWKETAAPLVAKALREIKANIPLDWHVQDVGTEGQRFVNITMGKSHSGMYNQAIALIKHGGSLIFTPAYNGDIFVIVNYPYIEDHMSQLPAEVIERIAPSDVTEEYVFRQAQTFLQEMTAWEEGIETPLQRKATLK
jgi:hypothetical protein